MHKQILLGKTAECQMFFVQVGLEGSVPPVFVCWKRPLKYNHEIFAVISGIQDACPAMKDFILG